MATKTVPATLKLVNPFDIRIIGGAILPDKERGKHDTGMPAVDDEYFDERLTYDLTALPDGQALLASVKAHGVETPPDVVTFDDGVLTTRDGRQRIRAARLAKLKEIAVLVSETTDNDALSGMRRNIHVPDSITVLAAKAKRRLDAGDKPAEVAAALGTKVETLKTWMEFSTNGIPEVQQAVAANSIPFGMGLKISRCGNATAQTKALVRVQKLYEAIGGAGRAKGSKGSGTSVAADAARAIAEASGKRPTYRSAKDLSMLAGLAESQCPEGTEPDKEIGEAAWWHGARDMLRVITGDEPTKGVNLILDLIESVTGEDPGDGEADGAESAE